MIYATKKQNESNERLMSRFKKVVQRSRLLNEVKTSRYHKRPATKSFVRRAAVMRSAHRKRREREQMAS